MFFNGEMVFNMNPEVFIVIYLRSQPQDRPESGKREYLVDPEVERKYPFF